VRVSGGDSVGKEPFIKTAVVKPDLGKAGFNQKPSTGPPPTTPTSKPNPQPSSGGSKK
jgi:hypothetical protein